MNYSDLKCQIEKWSKKFNPKYLLIEDKASGQSIIQDLKLAGYSNVQAVKPKLDKITRFASVVPIFEESRVLLPEKSSFNRELLNELTNFPNSKNDDIVDSVSQFLNFTKNLAAMNVARTRVL